MTGYAKTALLMAAMTAVFMGVGYLLGGQGGMIFALIFAALTNVFTWWNSDKMVLKAYSAQPVDPSAAPEFYHMVEGLVARAGLPMPKLYILPNDQPNAFATGRNPENAAVAVTTGLMRALTMEEVAGVVAHELAHVKHRDTLIMTVTATFAGAISMLGNFALFMPRDRNSSAGPLGGLIAMIVAPMAAAVVQMAISRTREYEADRTGAEICGQPLWLASALQKIEGYASRIDNVPAERNPATAPLFIINPLHAFQRDKLFSTHPSTANRVAALREMASRMGNAPAPRPAPPQARPASDAGPYAGTDTGPDTGLSSSRIPRSGAKRPPGGNWPS